MPTAYAPTLSTAQLNALAKTADVHPRTLMRYLAGLEVRPSIRARIERALTAPKRNEPKP